MPSVGAGLVGQVGPRLGADAREQAGPDGRTPLRAAGRIIGYASGAAGDGAARQELEAQASQIDRECTRQHLSLLDLVYEREPPSGRALARPGLSYALRRIAAGEAVGLVVAELSRLSRSVADLGRILDRLRARNVRLVAAAERIDTAAEDGRFAVDLLIEVAGWERRRLSERTRTGLRAARDQGRPVGRPAVKDDPTLTRRIVEMRRAGMTLQAIADRLNEEGVPTLRGGIKWRHSSVQAAAGYRRPRPA